MANKKISELTVKELEWNDLMVTANWWQNYKTTVEDVATYTDNKISETYAHKNVDVEWQQPEWNAGDIFVAEDTNNIFIKDTIEWNKVVKQSNLPQVMTQEEYNEITPLAWVVYFIYKEE